MSTFLFKITINKLGESQPYKIIHWLGKFTMDVNHDISHYIVNSEEEQYDLPLEIVAVEKVLEVKDVANALFYEEGEYDEDFEWNGTEPIEAASSMGDESLLIFDCECKEKIRCADGKWEFVKCPNCENHILRSEIKEAGGLFYYVRNGTENNNNGKSNRK